MKKLRDLKADAKDQARTTASVRRNNLFAIGKPLLPDISACNLSNDSILKSLKARYESKLSYSAVGDRVLLATNIDTPELAQHLDYFPSNELSLEAPHLYCQTTLAYMRLRECASQAIVVMGMPGSGKSTQIKKSLKHLSALCQVSAPSYQRESPIGTEIIQALELLEVFGSSTTRNCKSSSHYSLVVTVQLDKSRQILGAQLADVLFQRQRLTNVVEGDYQYHIFYYLLEGASSVEREELKLSVLGSGSAARYGLISNRKTQSGSRTTVAESLVELSDAPSLKSATFNSKLYSPSYSKQQDLESPTTLNNYSRVKALMQTLGIHRKLQGQIAKFLAGLLHLSSLEFSEDSYKKDAQLSIKNKGALATAAELLQVNEESLESALVCRLTLVGDALCTNFLNKDSAEIARDTLLNLLYFLLFRWLVKLLNNRLSQGDRSKKSLTFVNMASSDLQATGSLANYELISRDYAAAKISHHFSALLNGVNKNLVAESFSERPEVLPDNVTAFSKFIDFMDHPKFGLWTLLDRESEKVSQLKDISIQEKSALDLLDKIQQGQLSLQQGQAQLTNSGVFKADRTKRALFSLQHFYGTAKYDATQFIEHDTVCIRPEFVKLFTSQTHSNAQRYSLIGENGHGLYASLISELAADVQIEFQPQSRTKLARGTSVRASNDESGSKRKSRQNNVGEATLEPNLNTPTLSYGIKLEADLNTLLSTLDWESTWFVITLLCHSGVEPKFKQESHFNQSLVKAQLEYFNVVGWVNLARNSPFLSLEGAKFFQTYVPKGAGADGSNPAQVIEAIKKLEPHVKCESVMDFQLSLQKGDYDNQPLAIKKNSSDGVVSEMMPSGLKGCTELVVGPKQVHIYLKYWVGHYFKSEPHGTFEPYGKLQSWSKEEEELFDLYVLSSCQSGNSLQMPLVNGRVIESGSATLAEIKEQAKQMIKLQREKEKQEQLLREAEQALQRKKEKLEEKKLAKVLARQEYEESKPRTLKRKFWLWYTYTLTWLIPSVAIKYLGGRDRREEQMAWREKLALFMTVGILSFLMLFIIEGLPMIFCPNSNLMTLSEVAKHNSFYSNDAYIVSWKGTVVNYASFSHPTVSTAVSKNGTLIPSQVIANFAGGDARYMFPGFQVTSAGAPIYNANGYGYLPASCYPSSTTASFTGTESSAYVSSNTLNQYVTTAPCASRNDSFCHSTPSVVSRSNLGAIANLNLVGRLAFSSGEVESKASVANGAYVSLNDKVYSLSNLYTYLLALDGTFLNNAALADALYNVRGKDLKKNLSPSLLAQVNNNLECFDDAFLVGYIDTRVNTQCTVASNVLLACTIIVVGVMVFKFITAIFLVGSKRLPEFANKYVICQVPCYSENEESLLKTIDSIALTEYEDSCKLLFLIADGMVKGSGNDKPTPELMLNILGVDPDLPSPALSYHSIASGSKQHNCAKVYSGWYSINARQVPFIAVIKVGNADEISKPGNRGKRDSQMILMKFLNKVHYELPMSPMELEIYRSMVYTVGVDPILFEYCLMVDADTEVLPDSVLRLVASCVNDSNIMGICGETVIANERKSAVTMIQVYEYYISHHLAKAFESLFGSVTCLPGCFSLYRIRCSQKHVPILASSDIIRDYENNVVDTLHMKNLLSLGEDRYLTTLMLKYFPSYRTKFVPDARCRTIVPDEFRVLLSQRRRWINSTVHNMFELLLLNNLCGCAFVFSMRTVVFLDLFATLVSPAAVGYLFYLIVQAAMKGGIETIAIIMIAASYGIQALVFIIKGQLYLLGWMLVSLLAIPVFNFWLPLYAYWHFDDFSWGNTRKIAGMKGSDDGHGGSTGAKEAQFDPSSIPTQKWDDYAKILKGGYPSKTPPVAPSFRKAKRRFTGVILASNSGESSPHGSIESNASEEQAKRVTRIRQNITSNCSPQIDGKGTAPNALKLSKSEQALDDSSFAAQVIVEEVLLSPTRKTHDIDPLATHGNVGTLDDRHVSRRKSVYTYEPDSDEDTVLADIKQTIPARDQLYFEIQRYLKSVDLTKVTKKIVRAHLESKFACNLETYKDTINQLIEQALYEI